MMRSRYSKCEGQRGQIFRYGNMSEEESELYAAALGASESKGIVSLLCDLGCVMKPALAVDVKTTEHTIQ